MTTGPLARDGSPSSDYDSVGDKDRPHLECGRVVRVGGADGGEGGIRTHGTLARTTVFETVPIDHSGTSPWS